MNVEGSIASNDIAFLCQAAIAGLGVAFLPHMQVQPALASGALVRVLQGALESETRMAIVYVEREFLPPAVRAFVDAVLAWAKREGPTALWPELTLGGSAAPAAQAPAKHAKPRKR